MGTPDIRLGPPIHIDLNAAVQDGLENCGIVGAFVAEEWLYLV
tara:strand:- start:94 stop:222 length:129 start_codon:yes stop_codon:yes gene_type:complete